MTKLGTEPTSGVAKNERWPVGQVSLGIASALFATTAMAQTTLPPLSVESTKKAPARKAKAVKTKAPPPTTTEASASPAGAPASPPNALQATTGLGRVGATVKDIPQSVTVISREQIKEQNITTIDQALRNVPGVTVAIGEGGGGMNGDQFRIRGFQAKGDLYVDGLRDFGVYVRDAFAYEQLQVLKGPTSENFGMGTTGGAINLQQKTAHLGDASSIEQTIGMGPMSRTVIDINKQINATTAARAVGMYHEQDLVDRDHVFSDRWGFLGSLAFGLGTDTSLTLNYLHQDGRRKPDYGVPIVDLDAVTGGHTPGRPVTEYGVRRSNFYGGEPNIDESTVDMLTARLTHKVSPGLTIYNDTRVAGYSRLFDQQPVETGGCNTACLASIANGTFNGAYTFGGPGTPNAAGIATQLGFDQETWGAQNITTAVAKFNAAGLKHELVTGVDVFYQHDERQHLLTPNKGDRQDAVDAGGGTIGNPFYYSGPQFAHVRDPKVRKEGEAANLALFASDRVWLTRQLSILGGVRWDTFSARYKATNPETGLWTGTTFNIPDDPNTPADESLTASGTAVNNSSDTSFVSPKASVIWEPTKTQTYYASWSKSYSNLAGQFISNDTSGIGNATLKPEENTLWELGSKLSFLEGRLGLTAALFRVDKSNSTQTDPTSGDIVATNEEQRVQGVELGLTGRITSEWTVQASYTYLDSEILYNPAGRNTIEHENEGNRVAFVPEHAFSIWTTYDIAKMMNVRGALLLGGGVTYTGENFVNSANTSIIPANFSLDGLVSYEADGWRYALNGYNLTDELNYDASFGNRAVPSSGRTVLFTIGKKF
ncbi:MAG TPA: TonB-dependent receptor [Hyphomicrobiaceae bacterium]|nr:TonB-dependent receptor [Hyphomicrobiaceae bacterium]